MSVADAGKEWRDMADRLLIASSLLLVILTTVFVTFMNAEKFWQQQAITLEIALMQDNLSTDVRTTMAARQQRFAAEHRHQNRYGQLVAGLMAVVMFITAVCFPAGVWRKANVVMKAMVVMFTSVLIVLGLSGLAFAFDVLTP